jgi:hypothetical protein
MTDYTGDQEDAIRAALKRLARLALRVEDRIYTDGIDGAGGWLASLDSEPASDALAVFVADRLRELERPRSVLDRMVADRFRDRGLWELAFADACARADRQARAAELLEAFAIAAEIRDAEADLAYGIAYMLEPEGDEP